MRELIERGVLHAIVWLDTRCMLADGLTKGSVDRKELHAGMDGSWEIVDCEVWRPTKRMHIVIGTTVVDEVSIACTPREW